MNIAFLGGSFDPIHFGHLCAAQDALEGLGLDRVVFVPAAQAPLKEGKVEASDEQRLDLVRLAIAHEPRFQVSDFEILKGGISYTIESARHFRRLHPFDRLYWILGADQLQRLPLWSRIEEIVRLVEIICLERPGYPLTQLPQIAGLRLHRCPGHLLQISSTELRQRAARDLPLDCFLPHKAIVYLREKGLYRSK